MTLGLFGVPYYAAVVSESTRTALVVAVHANGGREGPAAAGDPAPPRDPKLPLAGDHARRPRRRDLPVGRRLRRVGVRLAGHRRAPGAGLRRARPAAPHGHRHHRARSSWSPSTSWPTSCACSSTRGRGWRRPDDARSSRSSASRCATALRGRDRGVARGGGGPHDGDRRRVRLGQVVARAGRRPPPAAGRRDRRRARCGSDGVDVHEPHGRGAAPGARPAGRLPGAGLDGGAQPGAARRASRWPRCSRRATASDAGEARRQAVELLAPGRHPAGGRGRRACTRTSSRAACASGS